MIVTPSKPVVADANGKFIVPGGRGVGFMLEPQDGGYISSSAGFNVLNPQATFPLFITVVDDAGNEQPSFRYSKPAPAFVGEGFSQLKASGAPPSSSWQVTIFTDAGDELGSPRPYGETVQLLTSQRSWVVSSGDVEFFPAVDVTKYSSLAVLGQNAAFVVTSGAPVAKMYWRLYSGPPGTQGIVELDRILIGTLPAVGSWFWGNAGLGLGENTAPANGSVHAFRWPWISLIGNVSGGTIDGLNSNLSNISLVGTR